MQMYNKQPALSGQFTELQWQLKLSHLLSRVQFNIKTKFVTSIISTGALTKQLSHVSSIVHFIHCLRLPYMFVPSHDLPRQVSPPDWLSKWNQMNLTYAISRCRTTQN